MIIIAGAGYMSASIFEVITRSGITDVIVAEREQPRTTMAVTLTPIALPTIGPLPAFKSADPYWSRFEKRKRN